MLEFQDFHKLLCSIESSIAVKKLETEKFFRLRQNFKMTVEAEITGPDWVIW
jgi:hypothetical protein